MKDTNKLYRISYFLIILSGIFTIAFIIAFIFIFWSHPISSDLEAWAQFGDCFGGIVSPLLALVNICIFIILTLTIQKYTDKNNKSTLETNKQIALMSMKHEELKHFKKEMDFNLSDWNKNLNDIEKIKYVLYGYNILEYRMQFLFPELENSDHNKSLRSYIVKALNNYEEGRINEGAGYHIPISNTYGMLVSDLGEWTVK